MQARRPHPPAPPRTSARQGPPRTAACARSAGRCEMNRRNEPPTYRASGYTKCSLSAARCGRRCGGTRCPGSRPAPRSWLGTHTAKKRHRVNSGARGSVRNGLVITAAKPPENVCNSPPEQTDEALDAGAAASPGCTRGAGRGAAVGNGPYCNRPSTASAISSDSRPGAARGEQRAGRLGPRVPRTLRAAWRGVVKVIRATRGPCSTTSLRLPKCACWVPTGPGRCRRWPDGPTGRR